MKVLFLAKRHPQQRDLMERPYGRFYFLPSLLAARGHDVRVLLGSHRRMPGMAVERDGVPWSSHDVVANGLRRFLSGLDDAAAEFGPDWVVGCSDAWHGWLAHRLARRTGACLAIDAYDNYEAYMPWNLPLHALWRRAVNAADLVTAAGPQLGALLDRHRIGKPSSVVVPMAADPIFVSQDTATARAALSLPADPPLIGYCGSWSGSRGSDVIIEAFRRLRIERPDARLVLTGKPPAHALAEPGMIALGYVKDAQLPTVLSSLDVACVVTANTGFGRYSYPAKLCEAMACGVPVVATATEPVRWMLNDDHRFLAAVGDAEDLARRMLERLEGPRRVAYPRLPTWTDSAERLEAALLEH